MSYTKFYLYILENPLLYFFIFSITFFCYLLVFKNFFFSIFDPLVFTLLFSSCATSTVVFLYILKAIRSFYFINYWLTFFCFYGIFFIHGRRIQKENIISRRNSQFCMVGKLKMPNCFFVIWLFLSLLNISYHLFVYIKFGIPLFMESRLTVNMNGGVVNAFFARLQLVFDTLSTFMAFYLLFFSKKYKKLYVKFYFFLILVFGMLSGSKSSLINYLFMFSMFAYLTQNYTHRGIEILLSKKIYVFILIFVILAIFVVMIQGKKGVVQGISDLLFRFSATGDGYALAYPKDTIEKLSKQNLGEFLFGDFLSTFRLSANRQKPFGFELFEIANNVKETFIGPNPRFNLVGLAYFGFIGSLILSIASGIIFTFVRNFIVSSVNKSVEIQCVAYYFYSICSSIETDLPAVVNAATTNFLLQFVIFGLLLFVLSYSKSNNVMTENQQRLVF